MSLTCKQELYWTVWVVYQFIKTLQVGKEQVSTFVGSETTTETNNQVIRIHLVECAHDTSRITLALHPVVAELLFQVVNQFALEAHTGSPNLLLWQLVVWRPHGEVRLVVKPLFWEGLFVDCFPFAGSPCWHVHTVGHIIHMQLLLEVAWPYWSKHLLAYLAVQPAHTVSLLASVQCKYRHIKEGTTCNRIKETERTVGLALKPLPEDISVYPRHGQL